MFTPNHLLLLGVAESVGNLASIRVLAESRNIRELASAIRTAADLKSARAPCVNNLANKLLDLACAKGATPVEKDNYRGILILGLKISISGE